MEGRRISEDLEFVMVRRCEMYTYGLKNLPGGAPTSYTWRYEKPFKIYL